MFQNIMYNTLPKFNSEFTPENLPGPNKGSSKPVPPFFQGQTVKLRGLESKRLIGAETHCTKLSNHAIVGGFQPLWRILVEFHHFHKDRGENKKYSIRNHQLDACFCGPSNQISDGLPMCDHTRQHGNLGGFDFFFFRWDVRVSTNPGYAPPDHLWCTNVEHKKNLFLVDVWRTCFLLMYDISTYIYHKN